ncbi:MAG: NUDIX domain-containing protein [Patescibacteria group bacterium]
MPHIHEKIDFAVVAYIVHAGKVLLIKHKALGIWLPVGGHVELDEDPESAILREVREESGLEIELLGSRPSVPTPNGRSLIPPVFMDIHNITSTHQHIGLVYLARAATDQVVLAEREHDDIRWFKTNDLDDPALNLLPLVRYYAQEALRRCA